MNKYVFVFFLLFCSGIAHAQEKFVYSGTVKDAEGKPLPNTQVLIKNTTAGTLTDANGNFALTYTEPTATLTFSRLGFETITLRADARSKPHIAVVLPVKAQELSEIPITSERVQKLNTSVWDYGFLDEYTLLLKYKENSSRSRLVFMDYQQQEVASMDIPVKVTGLYRDCMNNMHLVSKDSVNQISFISGKISLMPGVAVTLFESYLLPCVAQDAQYLYFIKKEGSQRLFTNQFRIDTRNLALHYFMVNRQDKTRKNLVGIVDEKSLQTRADREVYLRKQSGRDKGINRSTGITSGYRNPKMSAGDEAALRAKNPISGNTSTFSANPNSPYLNSDLDGNPANNFPADSLLNNPTEALGNEMDQLYMETILFQEIYAPLFLIDGNTYVFDFTHARLLLFTPNGDLHSETPITFHSEKGWERTLLEDPKTKRIYSLYKTNAGYEIWEIVPQKGTVLASYPIPYPYIENIKVQGGYIYFLYQANPESPTKYLSRMRM